MNRFARSWEISKSCLRVLREDRGLMFFPLLSTCAAFIVLASFAVPAALLIDFSKLGNDPEQINRMVRTPAYYAIVFTFYFVNYFLIAFFNSALIACVMRRFDSQPAGVSYGLRAAAARLPQILGWALVGATVGMVLRAISERAGLIGRIVISLVGFVWTVATYLVVPVLVVEGLGPVAAVKRSAGLIRRSWGESLIINLGLGAISSVLFVVCIVPVIAGVVLSIVGQSAVPMIVGIAVAIPLMTVAALVASTLRSILIGAIYRYAATGTVPAQFDGALLQQAFRSKKKQPTA